MMSSIRLTSGHPAQMLLLPPLPAEQQCPPPPPTLSLYVLHRTVRRNNGTTFPPWRCSVKEDEEREVGRSIEVGSSWCGGTAGSAGKVSAITMEMLPIRPLNRRQEEVWEQLDRPVDLHPASSCDPRPEVRGQRWLIKPCRWKQFTCLSRVSAPVFTSVISSAAAWQKQGGPQLMILYNHYSVNTVINQHK